MVALEPLPARAVGGFEAPRPAGLPVGSQQVLEGVECGRLPRHCEVGDQGGPVGDRDEHAVHPPPPYEHLQRERGRVGAGSSSLALGECSSVQRDCNDSLFSNMKCYY